MYTTLVFHSLHQHKQLNTSLGWEFAGNGTTLTVSWINLTLVIFKNCLNNHHHYHTPNKTTPPHNKLVTTMLVSKQCVQCLIVGKQFLELVYVRICSVYVLHLHSSCIVIPNMCQLISVSPHFAYHTNTHDFFVHSLPDLFVWELENFCRCQLQSNQWIRHQ
jgi:hypothetical protein